MARGLPFLILVPDTGHRHVAAHKSLLEGRPGPGPAALSTSPLSTRAAAAGLLLLTRVTWHGQEAAGTVVMSMGSRFSRPRFTHSPLQVLLFGS